MITIVFMYEGHAFKVVGTAGDDRGMLTSKIRQCFEEEPGGSVFARKGNKTLGDLHASWKEGEGYQLPDDKLNEFLDQILVESPAGQSCSPFQQGLLNCLRECVSDWDNDFSIAVEPDESYGGYWYFSVTLKHKALGRAYRIQARVNALHECEIEFGEDAWEPINKGTLFSWMWFDSV